MTRSGSDDRRRTGRSGGLLASAVVLGLGVAAVGVHAAAGATLRDSGLVAAGAVGLALLFAVAALVTAARYREHVRSTDAATTAEDRLRQATIAVLFASAALVPFALLLLRRPVDDAPALYPTMPTDGPKAGTAQTRVPPTHAPTKSNFSFDLRTFVIVALIVIGVLILAGLIAVMIRVLRNVPIAPPIAATPPTEQAEAEDEALADALLAGRRALDGDDVRAAIIACYAALEASLEQAGVMRERSDSPSDLLGRAMVRSLEGSGAQDAAILTELFREARFSTHPMTAEQLEAARSALDAVTAVLTARIRAQAVAS